MFAHYAQAAERGSAYEMRRRPASRNALPCRVSRQPQGGLSIASLVSAGATNALSRVSQKGNQELTACRGGWPNRPDGTSSCLSEPSDGKPRMAVR